MRRHKNYQLMVACEGPRTAHDQAALAGHLERCENCRQRVDEYAEQVVTIRSLPREQPSPQIRRTVLAKWNERGSVQHPRRHVVTKRTGIRIVFAATLLGAVTANTPLPGVVAGALGIGKSPTYAAVGVKCNADGAALLRYAKILNGPSDYNPGPHGVYNQATGQQAAAKLLHPVWYVMSDNGQGIATASCQNVSTADTEIGFNPDTHTQLHVWGVLRDPSNP